LGAKPREVWCLDASDDRKAASEELWRIRDIAFTEMGIVISDNFKDFKLTEDQLFTTTHSVGKIVYPDGPPGKLIVLKLGLVATSAEDLRGRRLTDRGFPHHPTMPQQFYDRDRMDAYRRVGREVASRALAALNAQAAGS